MTTIDEAAIRARAEKRYFVIDREHIVAAMADARDLLSLLDAARRERDEYRKEWESACERLAADPHNAKAFGKRVAELLHEIRELRRERDEAIGQMAKLRRLVSTLLPKLDDLTADRDALRAALEFYADPIQWTRHGDAIADEGKKARKAIADLQAKPQ